MFASSGSIPPTRRRLSLMAHFNSSEAMAERSLQRNPYLALKNVSCDWLDGVLVLRGCLPSYYLKQIAQEAVASLEGVERIDNQIQVVTPAYPSRQG